MFINAVKIKYKTIALNFNEINQLSIYAKFYGYCRLMNLLSILILILVIIMIMIMIIIIILVSISYRINVNIARKRMSESVKRL